MDKTRYILPFHTDISRGICYISGGASKTKSNSQSTSESFQGINDPFTIQAMNKLIANEGVTTDLAAQKATKATTLKSVMDAIGQFTPENAVNYANGAVAQLVRQQNEANKPVISNAVEGSGTSGSSMAALLSNDLATRSSQAGATLAAQLVSQFGQIQAQNLGTASNLSQLDPTAIDALLKTIASKQVATQSAQSTGSSKGSSFNAAFNPSPAPVPV